MEFIDKSPVTTSQPETVPYMFFESREDIGAVHRLLAAPGTIDGVERHLPVPAPSEIKAFPHPVNETTGQFIVSALRSQYPGASLRRAWGSHVDSVKELISDPA